MVCWRDKNRARRLLAAIFCSALGCSASPFLVAQIPQTTHSADNNPTDHSLATTIHFLLPAQPLGDALLQFSRQSGVAIYSSAALLRNLQAPAISGQLTVSQALSQLLRDSGLDFIVLGNNAVMIVTKPAVPARPDNPPLGSAPAIEEVRVSGMRWSLQHALQKKRHSNFVNDVIASESLGKFPDNNVVESLQRMTGVAITRARAGDGQFITVRGMGQQFNRVTLNGIELATDNIGREFSFDVFPAELIAEAQVIKSPLASQHEGAIGATIDMRTPRPLDGSDTLATLALGSGYDELSRDWGEKISAAYSNSFMDERLGLMLGFSHSRRNWRSDMAQSLGFGFDEFDINQDGSINESTETGFQRPGFLAYPVKWGERRRTGIIGTVEYRPAENFSSSFDFFVGDFKTPEQASYQTNNFYYPFRPGSVTVDHNKTVTHFVIDDYFVEVAADPKNRRVQTELFRWQGEWRARDNLTLSTTLGYSSANRPEGGDTQFWVAGVPGARVEYWSRTPVPEVKITLSDGRDISQLRGEELQVGFMETKGDDITDDSYSLELDANYLIQGELLTSIDTGIDLQQRIKDRRSYSTKNRCAYCEHPFSFGDLGLNPTDNFIIPDFLATQSGSIPRHWPILNVDKVFSALQAAEGRLINPREGQPYEQGYSDNVRAFFNPTGSSLIEENVKALFAQFNFSQEPSDTHLGWRANLGIRLVNTDTIASGAVNEVIRKQLIENSNNYELIRSDIILPAEVKTSSQALLPSANLAIELTADSVLRFALARTLARPSLAQLGMETTYEVNDGEQRLSRLGNPYLKPVMATQFDISSEWYISPQSAVTFSIFAKDIEGFVANRVTTEKILGEDFQVTQPINNDRAIVVGSEFSLQKLWQNGMGIQLNQTFTHSDVAQGNSSLVADYGLENLSKYSYNLVALYEKYGLSLRLALNHRADYLQATTGQASRPEIVDDYRQVDFSASYQLTDTMAIYCEGINLLAEPRFVYSEFTNRLIEYEETGRRYYLGVRFSI